MTSGPTQAARTPATTLVLVEPTPTAAPEVIITLTQPIASTSLPTAEPTPTPTPVGPPHVILMVVDSLRADHVSAYGYSRATTPNLDALVAAQGVRFSQAISTSPWTCPANAALLTGLSPTTLGSTWTSMDRALPSQAVTLAEHLKAAGYRTAGFVNNSCLKSRFGFGQGFDDYQESALGRPGVDAADKVRAEEVNSWVLDWLQSVWSAGANTTQPLFLFIYYMEPHVWYDPPPPYSTLFDPDYRGSLTPERFGIGQGVVSGELVLDERDRQHLLALYDGEIAAWDAELGELLIALQEMGLLEDSLLIVTADHGELFGEHGRWVHGSGLYQEVIQVPLLLRYPGVLASGLVVDSPVQSMDLMPAVLEFAGLPVPPDLQAVSLRPLALGSEPRGGRAVFSELDGVADPRHWAYWLAPRDNLRAVQLGSWKLIQPQGTDGAAELYQLQAKSPFEEENLLAEDPLRAQALRAALEAYFAP